MKSRKRLFLAVVAVAVAFGAGGYVLGQQLESPEDARAEVVQLQARLAEVPKDAQIVCICRSGARSGRATAALAGAGYRIENLEGGMQAWESDGHDLVDASGNPGIVI